ILRPRPEVWWRDRTAECLTCWRARTRRPGRTIVSGIQGFWAEPAVAADGAGIPGSEALKPLQPVPLLTWVGRRQDGMVDLASPSWGRILRVGLLLCAPSQ